MPDPNYKALCAELSEALCGYTLSPDDCLLVNQARAALAQPDLISELVSQCRPLEPEMAEYLTPQARWRLYGDEAQPEPVAPTDEDLEDLAEVMNVSGNPVPAMRRALELWGRSTPHPPADGEVAELAAELRHFIAGYQQMRGLDPEHVYSIHRGDAMEAHLRISRLSRTAELLERRANALPTPEVTNV